MLKELLTLLCVVVEGVLLGEIEREAGEGCHAMPEDLWIVFLFLILLFFRELPLAHAGPVTAGHL